MQRATGTSSGKKKLENQNRPGSWLGQREPVGGERRTGYKRDDSPKPRGEKMTRKGHGRRGETRRREGPNVD